MRRAARAMIFISGVLVVGLTAAPGLAGDHKIIDEARFFSADTIRYAAPILDQIHDQLHHDLMVETFPSVPDELRPLLARQDKETFYNNWIISEARKHGVNGVFILVTRDPPRVQVGVGNKTRDNDFTLADRDQLVERLAAAFHKGASDDGLLDAVKFVRQTMAGNEKVKLPPDIQPAGVSAAPVPATRPTSKPAAAGDQNK